LSLSWSSSCCQGLLPIRRRVAAFIEQRDGGVKSSPDDIFLTDGASPAVQISLQLCIKDKNDAIMVPIPQYPLYQGSVNLFEGNTVVRARRLLLLLLGHSPVHTRAFTRLHINNVDRGLGLVALQHERTHAHTRRHNAHTHTNTHDYLQGYYLDEEAEWGMNMDELERAYLQGVADGLNVRAIAVINPGNPVGNCLSLDDMRAVVHFCVEKGIVLLADEVYQVCVCVLVCMYRGVCVSGRGAGRRASAWCGCEYV
jgi:hypothetical protein